MCSSLYILDSNLKTLLMRDWRGDTNPSMVERFVSVTRATIKGTLVIGVVQGGLAGIAFWVVGIKAGWGTVRWRSVVGTMAVLALIVWGIPNTISYTTGQFLEWNHGRFHFEGWEHPASRGAPIGENAATKVGWGVAQGLLTSIAGSIWLSLWGTICIWLPARLRRGKREPREAGP